jgi:hypothetical protein
MASQPRGQLLSFQTTTHSTLPLYTFTFVRKQLVFWHTKNNKTTHFIIGPPMLQITHPIHGHYFLCSILKFKMFVAINFSCVLTKLPGLCQPSKVKKTTSELESVMRQIQQLSKIQASAEVNALNCTQKNLHLDLSMNQT